MYKYQNVHVIAHTKNLYSSRSHHGYLVTHGSLKFKIVLTTLKANQEHVNILHVLIIKQNFNKPCYDILF